MPVFQIQLSTDNPGVFHTQGITATAAAKASHLLQRNHEINDIIFNSAGFHSMFVAVGKLINHGFDSVQ